MATPRALVGGGTDPLPPAPRPVPPAPVQWHIATPNPAGLADRAGPSGSVLWKAVKRNLLFWKGSSHTLQVSVFGPPAVAQGQTAGLGVFLHPPDAAETVRTLARAFQLDAEFLGAGVVGKGVARGEAVDLHLTVANAGVSRSVVTVTWSGQPQRVGFDLHVPWESPAGPAPGLVSVGRGSVRIGRAEFEFLVLPRRG